jgi:hypothetical protein
VTGLPECPRCGGPSRHHLAAYDRNRSTTDERFEYRRCEACGVIWLLNVPQDLGRHYPTDYHAFMARDELFGAAERERPRVELLTKHVQGGQMVEIGPSQGVFSAAAAQAGFDVVALEMDAACCRHLEDVVGVRAIHTSDPATALATLAPSRAAVMWHVLEHLPDAWDVVRAIAANLEPGGVLGVATPNPESAQARLFRSRWVHLDAPRHVTLVPLGALEDEGAKLGLRLVSSTTSDPVGRQVTSLGWERSLLRPPTLRDDVPEATKAASAFAIAARPWEERGLRGASYTAVFQKAA